VFSREKTTGRLRSWDSAHIVLRRPENASRLALYSQLGGALASDIDAM